MSAIANALIAAVIAPRCACCDRPLDDTFSSAVCESCWRSIPPPASPLCAVCGDARATWPDADDGLCNRCQRHPRVISRGRSIAPYEGTLREVIHALKYERRRSLAGPLGALMARAGEVVLRGADAAVPVPLHFLRHYSRGFNQAAELASAAGLPVLHALRRTRRTIRQTDLPEAERHKNVSGAFAVKRRIVVRELVLVVVDDVSTTGATIDACARALLDAGAKDVRALTAARAAARLP